MTVRYGIQGPNPGVPQNHAFEASQPFHRLGAAFVTLGTDGHAGATVAADTVIFGWWNVPGFSPGAPEVSSDIFTTSSTDATVYEGVVPGAPGLVFKVPTDAALTQTHIGANCDIVVTSSKMMADLDTSTTDVLRVVGSQRLIDRGLSEALVQIDAAALQSDT